MLILFISLFFNVALKCGRRLFVATECKQNFGAAAQKTNKQNKLKNKQKSKK